MGGKVQTIQERIWKNINTKTIKQKAPFLNGLFKKGFEKVWMSHGDAVSQLPKKFVSLAKSDSSDFAIVGDFKNKFFGVQVSSEVFHTKKRSLLFKKLLKIANIKPNWTASKITEEIIYQLKKKIGKRRVLCALCLEELTALLQLYF